MTNMADIIARLFKDEEGATAIEYGLLAALIAVAIIGAVTSVGSTLDTNFDSVAKELCDGTINDKGECVAKK